MNEPLRLMAVLAHPDDESLGFGGTLARYAAEGVETSLVMATRGDQGWGGIVDREFGPAALARVREGELREAAAALGIRRLTFLDESDGHLEHCDAIDVIGRIVAEIRIARPDVVVTFGPDGAYGHPDHIAISQLTTSAVMVAADPRFPDDYGVGPFRVSKLYYRVWTNTEAENLQSVFGDLGIDVNGSRRTLLSWPEWSIAARIDTADFWWEVQSAVQCHQSQIGGNEILSGLSARELRTLWGTQHYHRALSAVPIGSEREDDLFAGLRDRSTLEEVRLPQVA